MLKRGGELSVKEISNRYSKIVEEIDMPSYFYKYAHSFLENSVDLRRKKVLDFGCGNGFLLEIFLKKGAKDLYGIDVSSSLVSASKKRLGKNAIIKQYDGKKIPFKDNYFDVISMTEVFEHLLDPIQVMQEVKRVLKKDGVILITVPNGSAYRPFWDIAELFNIKKLKKVFLPPEHPDRTHQPIDTCYKWSEILSLFDELRLRIVKNSAKEYFPYLVHFFWRRSKTIWLGNFINVKIGRIMDFIGCKRLGYRCFFILSKY